MKRSAVVLALLAALTLTGCAGSTEAAPTETETVDSVTTDETPAPEVEETEKMSAANSADITAAGEVCDPGNANDAICAAFYPDQAVINMTNRTPALAGIPEAERIELAKQACEDFGAVLVADGQGDINLHKAAAFAYCNEHVEAGSFPGQPDRNVRIISFYKTLGEAAAKDHFADKVMPTAEELGY